MALQSYRHLPVGLQMRRGADLLHKGSEKWKNHTAGQSDAFTSSPSAGDRGWPSGHQCPHLPPPSCAYCSAPSPGGGYTRFGWPLTSSRIPTVKKRWSSESRAHTTSQVSVFTVELQILRSRCLRQCSVLQKYKMPDILKIKSWTRLMKYLDGKLHCQRRNPKWRINFRLTPSQELGHCWESYLIDFLLEALQSPCLQKF